MNNSTGCVAFQDVVCDRDRISLRVLSVPYGYDIIHRIHTFLFSCLGSDMEFRRQGWEGRVFKMVSLEGELDHYAPDPL